MTTQGKRGSITFRFEQTIGKGIAHYKNINDSERGMKDIVKALKEMFSDLMLDSSYDKDYLLRIITILHKLIDSYIEVSPKVKFSITDFFDNMLPLVEMFYILNYKYHHGFFPGTFNLGSLYVHYEDIVYDLDFRYFARSKLKSIVNDLIRQNSAKRRAINDSYVKWIEKSRLDDPITKEFILSHIPISREKVIEKLRSHDIIGYIPELVYSKRYIDEVCDMLKLKYRQKFHLLEMKRVILKTETGGYKEASDPRYEKYKTEKQKNVNIEDEFLEEKYKALWYKLSKGEFDENIFDTVAYRVAVMSSDLKVKFEEGNFDETSEREIILHRIIQITIKTVDNLYILRDYIERVKDHDNYLTDITVQLTKDIDNVVAAISEVSCLSIDDELMNCFSKELLSLGFKAEDIVLNPRIITDIVNRYTEFQIRRKFQIIVDVSAIAEQSIQQLYEIINMKSEPNAIELTGPFIDELNKAVRETDYQSRERFLRYRSAFGRMIHEKNEINVRDEVLRSIVGKLNQSVKYVQDKVNRAGSIEFINANQIKWNKRLTFNDESKNRAITEFVFHGIRIEKDEILKKSHTDFDVTIERIDPTKDKEQKPQEVTPDVSTDFEVTIVPSKDKEQKPQEVIPVVPPDFGITFDQPESSDKEQEQQEELIPTKNKEVTPIPEEEREYNELLNPPEVPPKGPKNLDLDSIDLNEEELDVKIKIWGDKLPDTEVIPVNDRPLSAVRPVDLTKLNNDLKNNSNVEVAPPEKLFTMAEELMSNLCTNIMKASYVVQSVPVNQLQRTFRPAEIIEYQDFSYTVELKKEMEVELNPNKEMELEFPEVLPPLLIQRYNLLYLNPLFPMEKINEVIINKALDEVDKFDNLLIGFTNKINAYLNGDEVHIIINFFDVRQFVFQEEKIYFMDYNYTIYCPCIYAFVIDCNLRLSALEHCIYELNKVKERKIVYGLDSFIDTIKEIQDQVYLLIQLLVTKLCPKINLGLDKIIIKERTDFETSFNKNYDSDTGKVIDETKGDYNKINIDKDRRVMADSFISYLNYFNHTLRLEINDFNGVSPGEKRNTFYKYLMRAKKTYKFNDMKILYVFLHYSDKIFKELLKLNNYEVEVILKIIKDLRVQKTGIEIYLIVLHYIFSSCSYIKGFMGSYNVNNFIHIMIDCEFPFLYKSLIPWDNKNTYGINYSDNYFESEVYKKKKIYSVIRYITDGTFTIPHIEYVELNKNVRSRDLYEQFYNVNLMSGTNIYVPAHGNDIIEFYGFKISKGIYNSLRQMKCRDEFKISNDVKIAFSKTKIFALLTDCFNAQSIPDNLFCDALKVPHWTCFFLDMNDGFRKITYEMHVFNKVFRDYDTVDTFSRGLNPYLYLAPFIPVVGYDKENRKFIRNVNFFQVEYEITRLKLQLGNILPIFIRFYISEDMNYDEPGGAGPQVIIDIPLMRLHDFFLSRFISPFYDEMSNDVNDFFEEYKTIKGDLGLLHNFDFRFVYRIELDIDNADIVRTRNKILGKMLPLKITVENEILIDFSYRIQIYSSKTEDELKYNCFIWSIMNGDDQPFSEDELYKIKERYSVGFITKKDIRKFAETFKCKIIIKQVRYDLGIIKHESNTYVFNPPGSTKVLKLGLIRYGNYSHYIPIFNTRISNYRLRDLDLESPLTYFYYDPSNSLPEGWRFADSFELFTSIIDKKYVRWLTWSENEDYNYSRGTIPVSFDSIKSHTLYQSSTIVIEKNELKKTNPIESLYVGDSETYVNEDKQLIPFCLCLYGNNKKGEIIKESFYGEDCQKDFLSYCCEHGIRLIYFHNLKFDGWLFKEFMIRDMIYHAGKLYSLTILMFYKREKVMITFKDSLALINSALRNFPKMFNLPNIEKELYPYNKISEETVERGYLTLDECREEFNEEDFEKFIQKGKDLNYLIEDTINIKKLTEYYCHIDVKLLYEGLECFNRYCSELFGKVQGCRFLTISGLSYFVMKVNCFVNLPQYKGDIKGYIRQCIRGGRCMVRRNEKTKVDTEIVDFDACSLYPSAMSRLYLPKGDLYCTDNPAEVADIFYNKLMYEDQIEITTKRDVSAMILKVKVLKVGKERDFPLLNVRENGINMYTNDVEGREFYLTHIELQDFIKYQEGEVEFINCIYWKGDKDDRMANFIRQIYDLRVEYKSQGNPMQEVLKLFMNSSYGKTIQKDVNEEFKFLNKEKKESFIINNFERIKEVIKINSKTYWIKCEGCSEPLTIPCQIGALILGMSKRIMNEVICLAEDNHIDVYYQDTDSIHIKKCDVNSLARAFEASYGRPLTGSSMGQFHVDFPLINNKDTWSKQSIFLGKKCYIDCLINTEGEEQSFIRMKGIPEEVIRTTCKEIGITEYDLYNELYDGKEIDFNLLKKKCPSFEFLKDFGIRCKQKFNRKIKF